jgi:hypothetical protein
LALQHEHHTSLRPATTYRHDINTLCWRDKHPATVLLFLTTLVTAIRSLTVLTISIGSGLILVVQGSFVTRRWKYYDVRELSSLQQQTGSRRHVAQARGRDD